MSDTALAGLACSRGTLLGGRVIYEQLCDGYRTGIEPVLLAAAVPARAGERVVEAGTGAGAGLLCLAARVPGLSGIGLEIDPAAAALATRNFAANGRAGLQAWTTDVTEWRATEVFDHAFANPPWHPAEATPSPGARRRVAKVASEGLLARWAATLGGVLRPGGTLCLILPAGDLASGAAALQAADCPEITVFPLWPHAKRPARLAILRGVRHGRGPGALLPGLVLHRDAGGYTDAAEAVLRQAQPLAA